MKKFVNRIRLMNRTYELPLPTQLTITPETVDRLKKFKDILSEELDEIDTIIENVGIERYDVIGAHLADLLGDLVIYCVSEMVRFGIPVEPTLDIIMDSNFSKLGLDNLPIKDERGKFLKGPNYWKPEEKLRLMLVPPLPQ